MQYSTVADVILQSCCLKDSVGSLFQSDDEQDSLSGDDVGLEGKSNRTKAL